MVQIHLAASAPPLDTSGEEPTVIRCFALPADFLRVAQDVFCEEDLREEDSWEV